MGRGRAHTTCVVACFVACVMALASGAPVPALADDAWGGEASAPASSLLIWPSLTAAFGAAEERDADGSASAISIKAGDKLRVPAPERPLSELEILVDDRILDGLSSLEDGELVVEPPFAQAGPHRLSVRTKSGEEILAVDFTIARASFLDALETSYSASTSHTTTKVRESDSAPESSDDLVDSTADGSVVWTSGRWKVEASANAVASESDTNSPFQEFRGDIQNAKINMAFADEDAGFSVGMRVGDVDIAGSNQFVSSGFSGRGLASTLSMLQDRLRFDVGLVSGVSVIGARDGARTPENENFRFGGELTFDLATDGPVTASLGATGLLAKRELSYGFGASGVDNVEDNRAYGLSVTLGALDNRARYTGMAGRSLFATPGFDQAGRGTRDLFDGFVHDHQFAFDVLSDEQTVSTTFGYQHVEPNYQAIEGFATADVETFTSGLSANAFGFDLSANGSMTRDNVDRIASQTRTRTLSLDATLTYTLENGVFGTGFIDSVNVNWSQVQIDPLDGPRFISATGLDESNLIRNTQDSYGVGLAWSYMLSGLSADSSVDYTFSQLEENTVGSELADTEDHTINISQSLSGDWWSLSGSAAIAFGREFDPETDGERYGIDWTLDASAAPEALPSIDMSFALGRATSEQRAFQSRDTSRNLTASVNVGLQPWLTALGLPQGLSTTLGYQRSRSTSESFSFSSDDFDERFILTFGGAL